MPSSTPPRGAHSASAPVGRNNLPPVDWSDVDPMTERPQSRRQAFAQSRLPHIETNATARFGQMLAEIW